MHINTWLESAQKKLKTNRVSSARLDCLVLLEDALGQDRAYILAHPETEILQSTEVELNKKIAQRVRHIPLAYIRKKAPFYGRKFLVNRQVLVPRPETEAMITLLKKVNLPENPRIADIGTGSGCLGITASLEINDAKVDLLDVSRSALRVAARNAKVHGGKTRLYESDLLLAYKELPDIILANLPYVPKNHPINRAAGFEPRLALFAGADGLDLYRRLWPQIKKLRQPPKFVLTESLPEQHQKLADLAKANGYRLMQTDGLIQCFSH
jgi:release factor glutamine methyltransferase